jgi:hypothetical protein
VLCAPGRSPARHRATSHRKLDARFTAFSAQDQTSSVQASCQMETQQGNERNTHLNKTPDTRRKDYLSHLPLATSSPQRPAEAEPITPVAGGLGLWQACSSGRHTLRGAYQSVPTTATNILVGKCAPRQRWLAALALVLGRWAVGGFVWTHNELHKSSLVSATLFIWLSLSSHSPDCAGLDFGHRQWMQHDTKRRI